MTKKIKETDDYKKVKQKFNSINNTGNNNTIIQGVSGNININKNTK